MWVPWRSIFLVVYFPQTFLLRDVLFFVLALFFFLLSSQINLIYTYFLFSSNLLLVLLCLSHLHFSIALASDSLFKTLLFFYYSLSRCFLSPCIQLQSLLLFALHPFVLISLNIWNSLLCLLCHMPPSDLRRKQIPSHILLSILSTIDFSVQLWPIFCIKHLFLYNSTRPSFINQILHCLGNLSFIQILLNTITICSFRFSVAYLIFSPSFPQAFFLFKVFNVFFIWYILYLYIVIIRFFPLSIYLFLCFSSLVPLLIKLANSFCSLAFLSMFYIPFFLFFRSRKFT